jgi:type II secretory pathway pseudopilin PulG
MFITRKKLAAGLTLMECLSCIVIICLLAAILFPVYSKARTRAFETTCTSNLKQIGHATELYRADYNDLLPLANPRTELAVFFYIGDLKTYRSLPDPLQPYGCTREMYHCPASTAVPPWNNPEMSNYLFRFVIDQSVFTHYRNDKPVIPTPSSTLVWDSNHTAYDPLVDPTGKWIFLRADGSVAVTAKNRVRKSFLVDGQWTFKPQERGDAYYEWVFPNESWPPKFQ